MPRTRKRGSGPGLPVYWPIFCAACLSLSIVLCTRWRGRDRSAEVRRSSILEVLATHGFDWGTSTTSAPISTVSVLLKKALANSWSEAVPRELSRDARQRWRDGKQDLPVSSANGFVETAMLDEIRQLCETRGCDPNEVDPEFGVTPLHVATLWGHEHVAEYLTSRGAQGDTHDSVGRLPRDMSFSSFAADWREVGKGLGPGGCNIPEVHLPTGSSLAGQGSAGAEEDLQAALEEARRLVSQGKPVLIRNALGHGLRSAQAAMQGEGEGEGGAPTLAYPDGDAFVAAWGHRTVDVGTVPYADRFNLASTEATLQYFRDHLSGAQTAIDGGGGGGGGDGPLPGYVFQQDGEACHEGFALMRRLAAQVFPTGGPGGGDHIICLPPEAPQGLSSMHYYLGSTDTGAPFHIHADAANLVVSGAKRWWVVPPHEATFSTKHIRTWLEEDYARLSEEERPMECVQGAGDIMYVPFDWGHAAINLEDGTFGYTMELVNRRDTLMSSVGVPCYVQ